MGNICKEFENVEMNFLHSMNNFKTVIEGEDMLLRARELRDLMGGPKIDPYYKALDEDCVTIEKHLMCLVIEEIKSDYRKSFSCGCPDPDALEISSADIEIMKQEFIKDFRKSL